jgi:hypothetical protein
MIARGQCLCLGERGEGHEQDKERADKVRLASDFGELCRLWGYTYEEHVALIKVRCRSVKRLDLICRRAGRVFIGRTSLAVEEGREENTADDGGGQARGVFASWVVDE